ncbi:MAG: hypothetical protein ACI9MB_004789 [Verrucomicrobiales bacterium]|jgi:hypothetical protein
MSASSPAKFSYWKKSFILLVIATFAIMVLAILELSVFGPQRLERENQARYDSPPKLIPPHQRSSNADGDQTQPLRHRNFVTAFRKEDWRQVIQPSPTGFSTDADPADNYLSGYIQVQDAEKLLEGGDLIAARSAYRRAAVIFDSISQTWPGFEAEMIVFRRQKIDKALAKLADLPAAPGSLGDGL